MYFICLRFRTGRIAAGSGSDFCGAHCTRQHSVTIGGQRRGGTHQLFQQLKFQDTKQTFIRGGEDERSRESSLSELIQIFRFATPARIKTDTRAVTHEYRVPLMNIHTSKIETSTESTTNTSTSLGVDLSL